MPTIQQLRQRHPSCSPDEVGDIRALYEGGKAFEKRLPRFLQQRPQEVDTRYSLRKSEAHYRNYLGPVVDYFTAMLFSARPSTVAKKDDKDVPDPGEYYAELRDDCDRNGSDIDAVFKGLLTEAMVAQYSWLRIHHPTGQVPVATKAEFEAQQIGDCWLEPLGYDDALDWETDDLGRLEWVLTHRATTKRDGVAGDRKRITETWEFVDSERTQTYQIEYDVDRPPSPQADVPKVGEAPHRFGAVPFVCLELPVGLWVGNRLKSPQLAHFRLSNAQTWGMAASCYAMPVFKLAQDAEGNFRTPTMGVGYGIFIGQEDDFSWSAPPDTPFSALSDEISAQKDEIFRIAHQMALGVENNAAAVGRSGESKKADIEATRVVLLAYSRVVKEAIENTYQLISAARGDDFDWSIEGLDDFAALDVQGLAETLKLVKDVGGIPSKTWNVSIKSRIAEALLPDMDQGEKQKVRKEILDGEPDPAAEREEQKKLQAEALKQGANGKPGAPGAKPFPPKQPAPPTA